MQLIGQPHFSPHQHQPTDDGVTEDTNTGQCIDDQSHEDKDGLDLNNDGDNQITDKDTLIDDEDNPTHNQSTSTNNEDTFTTTEHGTIGGLNEVGDNPIDNKAPGDTTTQNKALRFNWPPRIGKIG